MTGYVIVNCITDPCDKRGPTMLELIYKDGKTITASGDRLIIKEVKHEP